MKNFDREMPTLRTKSENTIKMKFRIIGYKDERIELS